MCRYNRGDIVWAFVPYFDLSGVKPRPLLIINPIIANAECKYLAIECYSMKEKYKNTKGIKILSTDKRFNECGFENDTFINCNSKVVIREAVIKPHPKLGINPLGHCNFLDEIEQLMGK